MFSAVGRLDCQQQLTPKKPNRIWIDVINCIIYNLLSNHNICPCQRRSKRSASISSKWIYGPFMEHNDIPRKFQSHSMIWVSCLCVLELWSFWLIRTLCSSFVFPPVFLHIPCWLHVYNTSCCYLRHCNCSLGAWRFGACVSGLYKS